jgi:hypothetical protein
MSTWHNINGPSDVDFNGSDNTVEIYVGEDYGGAIYVSVPMDYILRVLPDNSDTKAI